MSAKLTKSMSDITSTGESIDSYVASVRTLAKTFNHGSLLDSLIRDRIVVGIRDNGTHKQL